MDAQQFLADFRYIADAPGGIAQLRRTIYQLAITGSLTPRAMGSDTSQALLEEIQSARQRLIGAKKYKRMIELESEGINVPPSIVLPPSWCWTRLLDIGEINPRNDADDDTLAAFVPMSGVPQTHRAAVMADTIRWGDIKKGFTHFANGDVILGKITPCFENGKAAVIKALPVTAGIGAGTTELHVFRPIHRGIVPEFVYLFLRSPHFALDGERHMTGTAGQKRLPTDYFATRALPLPPFEEQVRIVAKVDELMALCDKLESQHLLRRKMQNVVRNAVLQGVSHSVDSRQLEKNWLRFTSHLELLFHSPDDISSLKGMILDLAVMGQFVASDVESQATGGDLIELIDTLRTAWYKSSQGQEQKEAKAMVSKLRTQPVSLPKATLPEQWRWSTLLRISQVIVDCDHKTPQYVTSGIHLIRTTDVRDGKMLLRNTKKVSEDGYLARSRRTIPMSGDIFFTREAPMGEAALVPAASRVCLGQRLMLIRLFPQTVSEKFLLYVIRSPSFQSRVQLSAIGMTVKHINVGKVEDLAVPVPPLSVQRRIVALVDALFERCDDLFEQLASKLAVAEQMAAFTAATITGITMDYPEDKSMATPKTELVAQLRVGHPPKGRIIAPLATILIRHDGELPAKDLWQRFGGEIDAFYAQLKKEVANGWIAAPSMAAMREVPREKENA